jgi:hypothetical protein
MTDRRQVLLALVSAFGLSLAGGYGYAAFSNEEKVEVTIDASNLDDSGEPEVDASSRNDSDGHAFGASAFGGGPASDASATPLRCTHHVDSDRDIDSDPDSNRGTDSDNNHDPDTIRWRKHQP